MPGCSLKVHPECNLKDRPALLTLRPPKSFSPLHGDRLHGYCSSSLKGVVHCIRLSVMRASVCLSFWDNQARNALMSNFQSVSSKSQARPWEPQIGNRNAEEWRVCGTRWGGCAQNSSWKVAQSPRQCGEAGLPSSLLHEDSCASKANQCSVKYRTANCLPWQATLGSLLSLH